MNLALNVRNWWEHPGEEFWAMYLRRSNSTARDSECHCRGGK